MLKWLKNLFKDDLTHTIPGQNYSNYDTVDGKIESFNLTDYFNLVENSLISNEDKIKQIDIWIDELLDRGPTLLPTRILDMLFYKLKELKNV